ncbi:MAG: hypothetical protein ABFS56_26690 [Pseudomonadota bacterium]
MIEYAHRNELDRLDFIQKLKANDEPIFDYDLETIKDILRSHAQRTLNLMEEPSS